MYGFTDIAVEIEMTKKPFLFFKKQQKHQTNKENTQPKRKIKLHLNDTGRTFWSTEEDGLYLSLGPVRQKHLSSLIEACCDNGHHMTQGLELGFKLSSLGQ